MSDCFDHEADAWEQRVQMEADGTYENSCSGYSMGYSRKINHLHYHNHFKNTHVIAETNAAYLIAFNKEYLVNPNKGNKCWVAKSLCREVKENSLYIWENATLTPIIEES